jgi:septation ring formation regulator EzrA
MKSLPELLILSALVGLVSCDNAPSSRVKEMRAEIQQINENFFEVQQTSKRLQSQLEAARDEKKKLEEAVKKASEEAEAARLELERVKQEFDIYKTKYKVSLNERLPNLPMPDFEARGQMYRAVTVTHLDEREMKIQHAGGLGIIPLTDLPVTALDYLALTDLHRVELTESTTDGRPISAKQQKMARQMELDLEELELSKRMKSNSDANTETVREHGRALEKLARAHASKVGAPALEKYIEDLVLRMNQLKAESAALEVDVYALRQKRYNLR